MASRNFGNVKAAAVKRHPGSNVTGVTNFERGLQLLRTPQRSQTPYPAALQPAPCTLRTLTVRGVAGGWRVGMLSVGGVAGTCTGSANLRRLATAACSARAAFMIRRCPWRACQSRSSLHSPDGRLAEARLRIRATEAPRVSAGQPP